jgi:hypothetical protein
MIQYASLDHMSDGSIQDKTLVATWSSADETKAKVVGPGQYAMLLNGVSIDTSVVFDITLDLCNECGIEPITIGFKSEEAVTHANWTGTEDVGDFKHSM